MGRPIKIKNSRNTKFTEESEEKEKVTRMNIVIASSLHHMIREVIIEEETGMKGFVTEAINKFIEAVADMDGLHVFMNKDEKTTATTVNLPSKLAKDIKRISYHTKITRNELMVRCLVVRLQSLKDKYPEYIKDTIIT